MKRLRSVSNVLADWRYTVVADVTLYAVHGREGPGHLFRVAAYFADGWLPRAAWGRCAQEGPMP